MFKPILYNVQNTRSQCASIMRRSATSTDQMLVSEVVPRGLARVLGSALDARHVLLARNDLAVSARALLKLGGHGSTRASTPESLMAPETPSATTMNSGT